MITFAVRAGPVFSPRIGPKPAVVALDTIARILLMLWITAGYDGRVDDLAEPVHCTRRYKVT